VLHLSLPGASRVRRVLALGSHADDIEIGCGATLLSLIRARPNIEVTWVVLGAEGVREREARASAEAFIGAASGSEIVVHGFRDGFFPYIGGEVKAVFEDLKGRLDPDVIFTHTRHDLHQDHRLVCELTWNTWRDHLVLEYEIPKYDGDLGTPNLFVPVSAELAKEKVRLLHDVFASQSSKHWFDEELFLGLMRIRGMEGRSPSGYAEAFTCRKSSLLIE
jgi:LmbE family N-acetylglucosaminyl deacetylase